MKLEAAGKGRRPTRSPRYGLDDLDRAIADSEAHGFVKVLTVPGKDRILGVTIVGAHAGELIAEYVLAMKHGIGLNKILGTIHIYPTLAEANKYVCRPSGRQAHAPAKACCAGPSASTPGGGGNDMKLARLLFAAALVAFSSLAGAQGFDHSHAAWNALMAKHVKTIRQRQRQRRRLRRDQGRTGGAQGLPRHAHGRQRSRLRQVEQAAAPGLPDQCLQRLHRRVDPDKIPGA
jgi:hypothetical protein